MIFLEQWHEYTYNVYLEGSPLVNYIGIYNNAELLEKDSTDTEKSKDSIHRDSNTSVLKELEIQYNQFQYDQILERNKKMADKMYEILMRSEPTNSKYFFAFGASHFRGEGSVNDHLEEKGFKVERVTADLN